MSGLFHKGMRETVVLELQLAKTAEAKAAWADKYGEDLVREFDEIESAYQESLLEEDDCDCSVVESNVDDQAEILERILGQVRDAERELEDVIKPEIITKLNTGPLGLLLKTLQDIANGDV